MRRLSAIGIFFILTVCLILVRSAELPTNNEGLATDGITNLRRALTGEPGIDYPIFRFPPVTSFSCLGRATGYYADVEARCQVFRVCTNTDLSFKGFAFLCPNGTLFNQKVFVCDWYTNVDCNDSENFYMKNNEMNMKMENIQDIMSMAKKMISFPMSDSVEKQNIVNAINPTTQAFEVTTLPSIIPTTSQPERISPEIKLPRPAEVENNQSRPPIQSENQNQLNSTDLNDNFDNFNQNGPVYVSSLGELSTHVGNDFDINKVSLLDTSEDDKTKKGSGSQSKSNEGLDTLKEKLNNFNDNDKDNAQKSLGLLQPNQRITKINVLGTVISSGEADLVEIIERVLNRKLRPEELNAILSGEADILSQIINQVLSTDPNSPEAKLLLQILNNALSRAKNSKANGNEQIPVNRLVDSDLLLLLQRILERNPTQSEINSVLSGETDLLSQIINTVQRRQPFGINTPTRNVVTSGEADLIQIIERILNRKLTPEEVNSILSGEGDLLSQVITEYSSNQAVTPNSRTMLQILSEALLQSKNSNSIQPKNSIDSGLFALLQRILQRSPTQSEIQAVFSGEADRLSQIINTVQIRQPFANIVPSRNVVTSGEADLIQIIERVLNRKLRPEEINVVLSGEGILLSYIINESAPNASIPPESRTLLQILDRAVSRIKDTKTEMPQPIAINDQNDNIILSALQRVLQRVPTQLDIEAVFSGEADLLSQIINRIQERQPFVSTIPSRNAVTSGEADLIQIIERVLNRKLRPDEVNIVLSGEADLLSQIINEYSSDGSISFNSRTLLQILNEAVQRLKSSGNKTPTSNGINSSNDNSALISLQRILQRIPTQSEISAVLSGEADLLSQIINTVQRRQPFGSILPHDSVLSGEADLLQIIERVINRKLRPDEVNVIFSGEADLFSQVINEYSSNVSISSKSKTLLRILDEALRKLKSSNTKPTQSNNINDNGALISLQRILQRILTQSEIAAVLRTESGEADLLSQIINTVQRRQPFANNIPSRTVVTSGEADLIQIIERVLNRKLGPDELNIVLSGEADLLSQIINEYSSNGSISPQSKILLQILDEAVLRLKNPNTKVSEPKSVNTLIDSDLLYSLQRILQRNPTQSEIQAVFSGEADLLSQIISTLQRRQPFTNSVPSRNVVTSGEADLIQIIERVLHRKLGPEEVNVVLSGEGILLSQAINEISSNRSTPPGSKVLLQILNEAVDKLRNFDSGIPVQTSPSINSQQIPTQADATVVFSGEADLLSQIINALQRRQPIADGVPHNIVSSGEAELVQIIERVLNRKLQPSEENAILSGEGILLSQVINEYSRTNALPPNSKILLQSLQGAVIKIKNSKTEVNEPTTVNNINDNGALISLQRILQRIPTQSEISAVLSGEADLLNQIINTVQRRQPFTDNIQLHNVISSGEADLIQIFERVLNRKLNSGEMNVVLSGEGILLGHTVNEFASNGSTSPKFKILLEIVNKALVRINDSKTEGKTFNAVNNVSENDLILSLQRILQRTPTQSEVNAVFSGEADLLDQVIFTVQRRQPFVNNISPHNVISSGEADLVQIIERVLHRKLRPDEVNVIFSGEGNLLSQTINEFSSNSSIAPNSKTLLQTLNEALLRMKITKTRVTEPSSVNSLHDNSALISLQRILQRVPTQLEINAVLSGEADLLSHILNTAQKRQPFTSSIPSRIVVNSGEADLIQIIERVLQRKLGPEEMNVVLSGEANLLGQVINEYSSHDIKSPETRILLQILNKGLNSITNLSSGLRGPSFKNVNKNDFLSKNQVSTPQPASLTFSPVVAKQFNEQRQLNNVNVHFPVKPSLSPIRNTYIPVPINDGSPSAFSKQLFTYPTEERLQTKFIGYNEKKKNAKPNQLTEEIAGDHGQQSSPTAYIFTEIENRPPNQIRIPSPPPPPPPSPPFRTDYSTLIQNNPIGAIQITSPTPFHSYNISSPLPSSLPSIVHDIRNIYPISYKKIATTEIPNLNLQSVPIITSTYHNRDVITPEKIVVRVIKAPGWYLNDERERNSYISAVQHGLLGSNGLVYVNNVQKEMMSLIQAINARRSASFDVKTHDNRLLDSISTTYY